MTRRILLGSRIAFASLLLATCLTAWACVACRADDVVTTTDLVEHMDKYDGKVVTVRGEAIGDLMVRGTHAWITVNDDEYAIRSLQEHGNFRGLSNMGIGVWVPESEGRKIEVFGGYKNKGSTVRLTGIFHRACDQHGGDTDIHADRVDVLVQGHPFRMRLDRPELIMVVVLGIVIAGLFSLYRSRQRRSGMEE